MFSEIVGHRLWGDRLLNGQEQGAFVPLVADRLEECCNLDKCPKSNKIAALFHPRHTQQEIADAVGVTQKTVDNGLESLVNLDGCPKLLKIAALFHPQPHAARDRGCGRCQSYRQVP